MRLQEQSSEESTAAQRERKKRRERQKKKGADSRPLHHPDQGAQEQHMADTPRFKGERTVSTASCVQEPFRTQVGRLVEAEPTIARRLKLSCGWDRHVVSHQSPLFHRFSGMRTFKIANLRLFQKQEQTFSMLVNQWPSAASMQSRESFGEHVYLCVSLARTFTHFLLQKRFPLINQ